MANRARRPPGDAAAHAPPDDLLTELPEQRQHDSPPCRASRAFPLNSSRRGREARGTTPSPGALTRTRALSLPWSFQLGSEVVPGAGGLVEVGPTIGGAMADWLVVALFSAVFVFFHAVGSWSSRSSSRLEQRWSRKQDLARSGPLTHQADSGQTRTWRKRSRRSRGPRAPIRSTTCSSAGRRFTALTITLSDAVRSLPCPSPTGRSDRADVAVDRLDVGDRGGVGAAAHGVLVVVDDVESMPRPLAHRVRRTPRSGRCPRR